MRNTPRAAAIRSVAGTPGPSRWVLKSYGRSRLEGRMRPSYLGTPPTPSRRPGVLRPRPQRGDRTQYGQHSQQPALTDKRHWRKNQERDHNGAQDPQQDEDGPQFRFKAAIRCIWSAISHARRDSCVMARALPPSSAFQSNHQPPYVRLLQWCAVPEKMAVHSHSRQNRGPTPQT